MGALSILNAVVLSFIVAELVRVLFFTKEWRYRFNQSHEPIENWKKALIVMLLFVFAFPFINWVFTNYVSPALESLGYYQISIFLVLLSATYIWIEKRIMSLPWDKWDLIPLGIIVLVSIVTMFF